MLAMQGPEPALDGACLGAGHMEQRRRRCVAGNGEACGAPVGAAVDGLLHLSSQFADMERTGIDTAAGRGDVAHDRHQFRLHPPDECSVVGRQQGCCALVAAHQTEQGVEVVHLSVHFDAQVVLLDPDALAKAGQAAVACPGVELLHGFEKNGMKNDKRASVILHSLFIR